MSDETIIGIDLGTTNSEVALLHNGQVEVLPDATGTKLLPSVVGVDDQGTILIGTEAANQQLIYPERTIRSIKRLMGSTDPVTMAGQAYTPQEISAMILRHLKQRAEKWCGHPIQKAVITVPAYFSDAQRQATREAGEIAGLEVVRMINEPTAAALTYQAEHLEGRRLLVYDLGGGTFDVSVVVIESGIVEVVSSHGDNRLGGDDFDLKIIDHVVQHMKETHDVDAKADPKAMARILRCAEAAKKQLSDQPFVTLEEEYLLEKEGTPIHLSLELSRDAYEEMIQPFIEKTLKSVHTALSSAKLATRDIEQILLVGGSTRTPVVRERLAEIFGYHPRGEINPDLCVAMGAAIQAGNMAGKEVSTILVDVTPYTFGVSALTDNHDSPSYPLCYVPIVDRNSPIPISKSEVFYTAFDGQEKVKVDVYQGEDQDLDKDILIGTFTMTGLKDVPHGNPILMHLNLDVNGVLHVTAMEKRTGLSRSITIKDTLKKMDAIQLTQAQNRLDVLFGEAPEDAEYEDVEETDTDVDTNGLPVELVRKVQELLQKAQQKMEQASADDQEEIIDLSETVRDALNRQDEEALKEPMEALSEILFYLDT